MAKSPEEVLGELEEMDEDEEDTESDDEMIIQEDMRTLGFTDPEQQEAFTRLVQMCAKKAPEDYSMEDEDEDSEDYETF